MRTELIHVPLILDGKTAKNVKLVMLQIQHSINTITHIPQPSTVLRNYYNKNNLVK